MILTFDRDYGRLIFEAGHPPPLGVVYFRLVPTSIEEPAERLLGILDQPDLSIVGNLTVVERDRMRQRPLPETPS